MNELEEADVLISADTQLPDELVEELRDSLVRSSARVFVERREPALFGSMEWVVPTLIVVMLTRKLFESFMTEAGKDLYAATKRALARTAKRTTGPDAETKTSWIVSTASPYKVSSSSPPVLSVFAQLKDGRRLRFTFTHDLSADEVDTAVTQVLEFLSEYYGDENSVAWMMVVDDAVVLWGTVPLVFDPRINQWRGLSDEELRRGSDA